MPDPLPRYTASAGVSVGPQIDTSEMYNSYMKIFNDIDQVAKPIATNLADQQAKAQGELAGQNPGFKSGPIIGRESAIYNQSALASNKMTITANAIQNINSMKQKALGINPDGTPIKDENGNPVGVSPESIEQFNNELKAHTQSVLETAPNENRAYFKQFMALKSTNAAASLLQAYHKRVGIESTFNLMDSNSTNMSQVLDAISENTHKSLATASKLMTTNRQSLESAAISNGVSPKFVERIQNQNMQSVYEQHVKTGFNTILSKPLTDKYKLQDQLKEIQDYQNNIRQSSASQTLLGDSKTNTLINNLKTIEKQRFANQGAMSVSHANLGKNLMMQSFKNPNQQLDPKQLAQYQSQSAISGKPEDYNNLLKESAIAQEAGSYVQNALSGDPRNIGMTLSQLEGKDASLKYRDNDDSARHSWYQEGIRKIKQLQDQYKRNPVDFIKQTPGYQSTVKNENETAGVMNPNAESDYIKNYQIAHGVDPHQVKIWDSNQLQSNTTAYKTANPVQRTNLINGWVNEYGNDVGLVFNQIENQPNGPKGLMTLYNNSVNPDTRSDVQTLNEAFAIPRKQAQQVFTDSGTKWPSAKNDIKQDAQKTLDLFSKQSTYDPVQVDHQLDLAASVASYLMGTKGMSYSAAIQKASDLIFNDHVNPGSFNGNSFAIPKYDIKGQPVDPTRIGPMLKTITLNKLRGGLMTDNQFPRNGLDEDMANQAYMNDTRLNGYWANTQGGFVFMNSLNRQVKDKNGNPITLKISDYQNPTSDQNKALNLEISKVISNVPKSVIPIMVKIGETSNTDFALKYINNQQLFEGDSYFGRQKKILQLIAEGYDKKFKSKDVTPSSLLQGSSEQFGGS